MRILIVKLSSLGDLFHALPAVHNLKTETGAEIDWVTQPEYVDLVRCFDDVSEVIAFPRRKFWQNAGSFIQRLRREPYDLIVDMQGLLKSALVTRLARGNRRIGPSFAREGTRLFYHSTTGKRDKNRHAVIENLDLIQHLELPLHPPVFSVTFPKTFDAPPRPHVVICPSSRWISKNWPADRFAATARHLLESRHTSITLLGAPSDAEVCTGIEQALDGHCLNLTGKTSIIDMGSVLKTADLLISNDSGPVHMAVAIGTPTLVVFGPTHPGRTGPFGDGHRVIQSLHTCQPCMRRRCRNRENSCIHSIPVEEVIKAADAILNNSKSQTAGNQSISIQSP